MDQIAIHPTTDYDYISQVFHNPTIYSQMIDDSCPKDPAQLIVAACQLPGFFLKALLNGQAVGLFWLMWRNGSLEAHTALLPECRGRNAIRMTKEALKWCFQNTETKEVRSYAWSDCPVVRWFCRSVGLVEEKTELWSNTRNGQPVNITYFSINRGAEPK